MFSQERKTYGRIAFIYFVITRNQLIFEKNSIYEKDAGWFYDGQNALFWYQMSN